MKFLVHAFEAGSGLYLYDAVTNRIFPVNNRIFENIDNILFDVNASGTPSKKSSDYLEAFCQIKHSIDKKIIGTNKLNTMHYTFKANNYKRKLLDSIRMLILEVTEDCNLRCDYCIYSGNYKDYRCHGSNNMSMSTICSAMNFYKDHNTNVEQAVISFYGGEPFLHVEKVVNAIEYGHKIFDKPQHYRITTNGTLIDDNFIDWFIKQTDVSLSITFNGDKGYHDLFRHFRDNTSSYEIIIKNIEKIVSKSSAAYKNRVSFQCNYLDWQDISIINAAFSEHPLLKDKIPRSITSINKNLEIEFLDELRSRRNEFFKETASHPTTMDSLILAYINELKVDCDTVLTNIFNKVFLQIYGRPMYELKSSFCSINACEPLVNRLYINTEGAFNLCERVGSSNCFGNIHEGFNYSNISKMLYEFNEACKNRCINCWALRFCQVCYGNVLNNNSIDMNKLENFCAVMKKNVEFWLKKFCDFMLREGQLLKAYQHKLNLT